MNFRTGKCSRNHYSLKSGGVPLLCTLRLFPDIGQSLSQLGIVQALHVAAVVLCAALFLWCPCWDLLKQHEMFQPPVSPVLPLVLAGCVSGTAQYSVCFCPSCSHSVQSMEMCEAYILHCEGGSSAVGHFCHPATGLDLRG